MLAARLTELGHPVRRIELADPLEVGAEFIRWEVATAAAGIVLGIDPFDQPNVQESKDATKELLAALWREWQPAAAGPIRQRGRHRRHGRRRPRWETRR